jgi:hypothetical protein
MDNIREEILLQFCVEKFENKSNHDFDHKIINYNSKIKFISFLSLNKNLIGIINKYGILKPYHKELLFKTWNIFKVLENTNIIKNGQINKLKNNWYLIVFVEW